MDDAEDLPLTYSYSYHRRGEAVDLSIISTYSQLPYVYAKLGQGYPDALYAGKYTAVIYNIYIYIGVESQILSHI